MEALRNISDGSLEDIDFLNNQSEDEVKEELSEDSIVVKNENDRDIHNKEVNIQCEKVKEDVDIHPNVQDAQPYVSAIVYNDSKYKFEIIPAKPFRIEQILAKIENTVTFVVTNLNVAPNVTTVETTMVVILNPYLSKSQHSGKTMMMKVNL